MGYDELDRPIARTNPKGEQWDFAYDLRDNRISATKPDGVELTTVSTLCSASTLIMFPPCSKFLPFFTFSVRLGPQDRFLSFA